MLKASLAHVGFGHRTQQRQLRQQQCPDSDSERWWKRITRLFWDWKSNQWNDILDPRHQRFRENLVRFELINVYPYRSVYTCLRQMFLTTRLWSKKKTYRGRQSAIKWMDRWENREIERWTDECIERQKDRLTKGQKDKLIQINGWTDKHADKGKALLLC